MGQDRLRTPWRPGPAGLPARAPGGSSAAGLFLLIGASTFALVFAFCQVPGNRRGTDDLLEWLGLIRRSNCGGNPPTWLQTLVVAQAHYRANDCDGDGLQDFWRGDVTGLYGIKPRGSDERIQLIEVSVAGADARPLTDHAVYLIPGPKAGYWFRALRHSDEVEPSPNRFAFCAFAATYDPRRPWTYIVDETHTIYRKDLGRAGRIDTYPAHPIAEGWSRLD